MRMRTVRGRWRRRDLELVAAATLLLAASAWLIARTRAQRGAGFESELRADVTRLSAVRREFQMPTPAESLAWRGSRAARDDLVIDDREKLSLAQTVASAAERAGITDVRIRLADPDSLQPPPRAIGAWRVTPASYVVVLEGSATVEDAARFLAALPRSVAVESLRLARVAAAEPSSGIRTALRVELGVYQAAGGDDTHG